MALRLIYTLCWRGDDGFDCQRALLEGCRLIGSCCHERRNRAVQHVEQRVGKLWKTRANPLRNHQQVLERRQIIARLHGANEGLSVRRNERSIFIHATLNQRNDERMRLHIQEG